MAIIEAIELGKDYISDAGKVGSGSGKSTLLSILGGLNPPSRGRVLVDGLDVYSLSLERRADFRHEYIGFVFQQLQLVSYLTALENVMLPLAISKLPGAERRRRAADALARVGLADKADRLPGALSGGEQGRVAVARAIVNHPPVVLADEPTGSLDSETGRQVMRLLRSLGDDGLAVVLVTHNEENAVFADRVIRMRDGRLAGQEVVVRAGSAALR